MPVDYSAMVGGPKLGLAQGPTRNAYDPQTSAALASLIRNSAPIEDANSYLASVGYGTVDPKAYAAAVAFAMAHHGATRVEADRVVPTTRWERFAASPVGSFIAAGSSAATAGIADTIGRSIAGHQWDTNREALSSTNPTADFLGNAAGSLLTPEMVARTPARAIVARIATRYPAAPLLGGYLSYGGLYGANEDPDDPLTGGLLGALTGGTLGQNRKPTGGLASMISPAGTDPAPSFGDGMFGGNPRRGLTGWPPASRRSIQ